MRKSFVGKMGIGIVIFFTLIFMIYAIVQYFILDPNGITNIFSWIINLLIAEWLLSCSKKRKTNINPNMFQ